MEKTLEQLEYLMSFYQKLLDITIDEKGVLTDYENEIGNEEDVYLPHALYHGKIHEIQRIIGIEHEGIVKEWRQLRLKQGVVTGREGYFYYEKTILESENPSYATHQLITNIVNSDLTESEKTKHIDLVQRAATDNGKVEVIDCSWDGK